MVITSFQRLALFLQSAYPKFRVEAKEDSRFMRFLALCVGPFNPEWLSQFTITIGYTVYMPRVYIDTEAGYKLLRHEAVHVADFDRFKWLFTLTYLFVLPTIFSMRAFWELRGYYETMVVEFEETRKIADSTLNFIQLQFTSANYFWMYPFKTVIRKKLERMREEIIREHA